MPLTFRHLFSTNSPRRFTYGAQCRVWLRQPTVPSDHYCFGRMVFDATGMEAGRIKGCNSRRLQMASRLLITLKRNYLFH